MSQQICESCNKNVIYGGFICHICYRGIPLNLKMAYVYIIDLEKRATYFDFFKKTYDVRGTKKMILDYIKNHGSG